MSIMDDITSALNGVASAFPEFTGTVKTKDGTEKTVFFTSMSKTMEAGVEGFLNQTVSDFKMLQANVPETGMSVGDILTLTDTRINKTYSIRILNIMTTLNFCKFYFENRIN